MQNRIFDLGQIVVTRKIYERIKKDPEFHDFVTLSLYGRYPKCDWGDTCEEDKRSNDEAVKNGKRILAVYKRKPTNETIWIITEWDRSVTTVLFPDEY